MRLCRNASGYRASDNQGDNIPDEPMHTETIWQLYKKALMSDGQNSRRGFTLCPLRNHCDCDYSLNRGEFRKYRRLLNEDVDYRQAQKGGSLCIPVSGYQLDDVDKQLLNLLQGNARSKAIELAEELDVSDNTIHNRMERLKEEGIITGYIATTDYQQAGLRLYFHFSCTARISERSDVAEEAIALPQVVEVTELMTGHENLHIKAVGEKDEDITAIAEQLDNLSLEINDENHIRTEHTKPLDYVEVLDMVGEDQ